MFTELPSIASSLSGGIGLGIGNAAGRGFDKASSALTAPARKITQRVVGERLDAKRQARQTLRTAGERQKLRAKQKN
jgi:hypothetical protein